MCGDADQKKNKTKPNTGCPPPSGCQRCQEAGKYLAFVPLGCPSGVNQRLLEAGVYVRKPVTVAVDRVVPPVALLESQPSHKHIPGRVSDVPRGCAILSHARGRSSPVAVTLLFSLHGHPDKQTVQIIICNCSFPNGLEAAQSEKGRSPAGGRVRSQCNRQTERRTKQNTRCGGRAQRANRAGVVM